MSRNLIVSYPNVWLKLKDQSPMIWNMLSLRLLTDFETSSTPSDIFLSPDNQYKIHIIFHIQIKEIVDFYAFVEKLFNEAVT